MYMYLLATLQHGYRGRRGYIWFAGHGVRGRSKLAKSGLYGSIGLVRRGKQHWVISSLWYQVRYWFLDSRKKFLGLTLIDCTWQWPCWRHCLDSEELLYIPASKYERLIHQNGNFQELTSIRIVHKWMWLGKWWKLSTLVRIYETSWWIEPEIIV